MLKRWRAKSPILFCIGAEILFLGLMFLSGLAVSLAIYAGVMGPLGEDAYFPMLLTEVVGAAVAAVLLQRTGRLCLLKRRGCGFLDGLLVGMYPLVFISLAVFSTLLLDAPGPMRAAWQIVIFLLTMVMVGVAEEWLFRCVIAQTLLEHFGTSRAGVWKAVVGSGILFGGAHLTNLLGSAPLGVLVQCATAAVLGMLLAAVYFRTGNIWVTVFIHAYMDVAGLLISGLYGTETFTGTVSSYDLTNLLSCVLYVIPTVFLLRGKKLPMVQLYFGADCAPAKETEAQS